MTGQTVAHYQIEEQLGATLQTAVRVAEAKVLPPLRGQKGAGLRRPTRDPETLMKLRQISNTFDKHFDEN